MEFKVANPKRGLSLLELMLVVILIGIIASIVVPRISTSSEAAKIEACHHNRAEINSALERYGVVTGSYPTSLSDVDTTDYFPGGIPVCPVTGNTYSMNATTHRVDGHTSSANPGDH